MIDSCLGLRVQSRWIGRCPYLDALGIMQKTWEEVQAQPGVLVFLGLEHPAVVTLGKRSGLQEIISSPLPVQQVDRGGQATVHSEGQLVVYPVVNLRTLRWGVKDFIDLLLETTSQTLLGWGISSERVEPAGLQTKDGKIAFLGLRVDQGITRHGLSLNISNDLRHFEGIKACGISQARLSKVEQYVANAPSVENAFKDWQGHLNLVLNQHLQKGSVGAVGSAFP